MNDCPTYYLCTYTAMNVIIDDFSQTYASENNE